MLSSSTGGVLTLRGFLVGAAAGASAPFVSWLLEQRPGCAQRTPCVLDSRAAGLADVDIQLFTARTAWGRWMP